MEKIIKVNEKEIPLKITAGFPLRYKSQFGDDILKFIMPMLQGLLPLVKVMQEQDIKDTKQLLVEGNAGQLVDALSYLEMEKLFNIVWVLAKTADNSIKEPLEWLDEFETFPLADVLPTVFEMIMQTFGTTQKSKKK